MDKFSFQDQPSQQLATGPSTANCPVCNEPHTAQSILCQKCQKSYHLKCVNKDNNKQPFTCDNCTIVTQSLRSPKSICSHRSNASCSSKSSTIQKKKNLELQRLEEERQLAKERDTEFLKQKYKILQQTDEDEIDDQSSVDINSVHEWLRSQTNHPEMSQTIQHSLIPPNLNLQNCSNEDNNVTLTSSLPNPCQVTAQALHSNMPKNAPVTFTSSLSNQLHVTAQALPNMPISNTNTNFHNKSINTSLSSTSYHNTTTFINKSETAPPQATITTAQPNNSIQAPASFNFHPSFSCIQPNDTTTNLTHQQINSRQTVPRDLPIFTGNPEDWPLFSSTFDWSTALCGLTDAENLVRLQKALRGDALKSVQHYLIHPSCVPAAIATLKLLYAQPEKILHSMKQKILSLPAVNINKLDTITSFAVQVKGLQAATEACGLLHELNNPTLLQELINKLPAYFQINWGTYKLNLTKQNKNVNLSEFADWIFDIGVSASSVNVDNSSSSAAESLSRSRQKNVYIHTHSTQNKKKCIVCGGDCINVANCQTFKRADRINKWSMVRDLNLCKQCLRKHFGKCNNKNICGVDNCQLKHHYLLHKKCEQVDKNKMTHVAESNKNEVLNENNETHTCNTHSATGCNNLFKIIPITIFGNKDKLIETFAFIDEGSSTTLIDEQIINDLDLSGANEPLVLKWTGSVERSENSSRRLCINVCGPNKKVHTLDVRTVKQLSLPKQSLNMDKLAKDFPYLAGLPVKSYTDATPRLLIGLNNSRLCVYNNIKEGKVNEPAAIRTRLGWLIYGTTRESSFVEHHLCHLDECNNRMLFDLMKKFYSLETACIDNSTNNLSKDDERALSILKQSTIQRPDRRYETSLLWRNDNFELPNSYDMALKRYRCLEKKLKGDSRLNDIFNKTIAEYTLKGYITKIDKGYLASMKTERVWYLPIFPVVNKNKPEKTRIVWDAAAKAHGLSLNDVLLKGPDMLCSLTSILMRFREKTVGICGDIEQMFHRIYIRKEDRNAQRFLWRGESDKEPDIYIMNVMIFGASCSPCISQYVKNVNAEKFCEKYPIAAAAIETNHYVDDYLDSVDTMEEAVTLAREVKYIHGEAGFNIRNWMSNKKDVLTAISGTNSRQNKSLNLGNDIKADKVLGVFWKSSDDSFTFKISANMASNVFVKNKTLSKRELLRILMSIYDPLGLIGHYLMYLKILLQDVWRTGVTWDEEISPQQMVKWNKWLSFLPEIENISIPRCYLKTFESYAKLDVQLHTFADASENGYAAVSYIRISNSNDVVVSLVGSKTRVAPLRIVSIPRLELMAAVIASRFANNIMKSTTIKVSRMVFWSDSKTVISWLRSDQKRYQQFVAVRVSEILDTTALEEWRWLPGKLNIADEATKWLKVGPNLSNDSLWFNGPEFLKSNTTLWAFDDTIKANVDCELKQHMFHIKEINKFIEIKNFSQWRRAVRAVAYVFHYLNKLKGQSNGNNLSQGELKRSQVALIRQAQLEEYSDEINILKCGGKINKCSPLYKLCPYLNSEDILCINSRIDFAPIQDEHKNPIIMPKHGYTTELIILDFHVKYRHGNHETVINEIRQKYYVPRLRTTVKRVIRKCQMCKISKAEPAYPQMAKLPRARVSAQVAPFTFTGLDFFGPIMVIVNRHKEKRYGALFTCLTIRAVHIEIVHSLNTSSCILAIRNFMARRGTPREFFSDNATNFVGAERELRETIKAIDANEFVRTFTTATTKWSFNPPAAPHMGGAWERMVRSIKTVLYKISTSRLPNDETIRSMMAEVENIINSRPLTYVPIDDANQEALTPNHLLLGSSNGMKPLVEYDDCGTVVKSSWLQSQMYAQQFWSRWLAEYLPSLTCRTKWFEKSKPLSKGDLVVVVDPTSPRNVWPRGKVLDTTVASDGQVRRAKIMTKCGVLERPAAKLAVLDVAENRE